jgi:VIT1/CCC1 family predicted Fe2+/Mn2+ transporter
VEFEMITAEMRQRITTAQKGEITEYIIYKKLAGVTKDPRNSEVLLRIARDELRHYNFWKKITGIKVKPGWMRIWQYYLVSRVFGLTFGIKLMEWGEGKAQINYRDIASSVPEALDIAGEEDEHEAELIDMINEERLKYVGSVILGLNDALVELSGALAGFTLALQSSRLVAMAGLITGIAASLSMASTAYLASKSEGDEAPLKSALYTGVSYVLTVFFLVLPYLIFDNVFLALAIMIVDAIIIIMAFNYYISVARDLPFMKRFSEMAFISLGVAAVSFGIGFLVRELLGVDI